MLVYGDSDVAVGEALKKRGYSFPTIYDIGGSNGAWTVIMSKVFPESRFELFEPLWNIDPDYKKNQALLKSTHPNSRMSPFAIGEQDGSIDIHKFPNSVGSTTLPLGEIKDVQPVSVPVRSIDSLVASGDYPLPDFIKMDIQGGELAALRGAANTLANVQFILLETWLQRGYGKTTPLLHELMEFLVPHGFLPYEFTDVYRGERGESIAIDVFFINREKSKEKLLL
jgi:FkbM family methyltransferase